MAGKKIPLGYLKINDRGKEYIADILNTNRLSRGKYTEKFEHNFAKLHGCSQGIFANSGTSALQIALAALKEIHGYQDGDEVIVPATTFVATSNIVLQNNLKPVFVDVEPDTFNIDVHKITAKITDRTRCIIPVHIFGLPCDMPLLMKFAKAFNLQVLEDCCETNFATVGGKSVGSFGDAACFSCYVAHFIVGGVGGLVTTSDDKIATLCRSLMAHGRDPAYLNIDADDVPTQDIIARRYSFDRVGYSYRATEFEAAIALSELEDWESNIKIRKRNAELLTLYLLELYAHIQTPQMFDTRTHMMYTFVLREHIDRDKFLMFLEERGIETRYLLPLLSQPVYQKLFPNLDNEYPVAKHLAEHGVAIGIHQGLAESDIEYIADVIYEYFDYHHLQPSGIS